MRRLIDAHALLWWLTDDPRLSDLAGDAIESGDCVVSAATVWEIAIKRGSGKLHPPEDLLGALARAGFEELAVTAADGDAAGSLPRHHGDPFDRMLVAQAQRHRLTIITRDPPFGAYDVPVLW